MADEKITQAFLACQLSAKHAEQWFRDIMRVLAELPESEARTSVKVAWDRADEACKALGKEIQKAEHKVIPFPEGRKKN